MTGNKLTVRHRTEIYEWHRGLEWLCDACNQPSPSWYVIIGEYTQFNEPSYCWCYDCMKKWFVMEEE